MADVRLATVGAVCALITVAGFVVGIVLMASSGVQVLIPDTGEELQWVADVDDAGNLFVAGAWIAVFAGLFGLFALVGFYEAFKEVGPTLIVAPIAGAVGLTIVTISHALPIAMAYELVPAYADGDAATRAAAALDINTLTSVSHLTNYVGNALGWGVAVPLYAFAILRTSVVPRWIGWVGMVAAVFAGWLGLLSPASSFIEGVSSIGFLAFFVFLGALGVALLRRRELPAPRLAPT